MQRRRSAPHTFEDKIAAEKAKLEAQVAKLKRGPQMDALREKIRQLETAHMNEWLLSPGCNLQAKGKAASVGDRHALGGAARVQIGRPLPVRYRLAAIDPFNQNQLRAVCHG